MYGLFISIGNSRKLGTLVKISDDVEKLKRYMEQVVLKRLRASSLIDSNTKIGQWEKNNDWWTLETSEVIFGDEFFNHYHIVDISDRFLDEDDD